MSAQGIARFRRRRHGEVAKKSSVTLDEFIPVAARAPPGPAATSLGRFDLVEAGSSIAIELVIGGGEPPAGWRRLSAKVAR